MKTQSIEVRTIKHQIQACLKLIELKVRSAVLRLLDLEEKLKKAITAMMTPMIPNLPVKKVYKKDIVNYYSYGDSKDNGDTYIFKTSTKPNGSKSHWLSVGKFISKIDAFGDKITEWHHCGYAKEIEAVYDGFKVKTEYEGRGNQQHIHFSFVVPKTFLEEIGRAHV